MSAKPRLTLLGLFSLFTLLGLVALPGRATAAATLTVTSPGTITTDSRPTITVNLAGSTTGDTISLSLQGGSGTLTSTGTGGSSGGNNSVVTVGDGVYTFTSAHITKPGTAYALTATVTAVTSGPDLGTTGSSTSFMVTPGAAVQLAFGQQPTGTPSSTHITPAVTVLVEDADGNLVNTSSAAVAVTLSGAPTAGGSAALTGTTPENAVGGVATFSDLQVDKAGTAYTLNMTSPGLTSATSSAFAITAGMLASLSFTQQPASGAAFASGAAIAPAYKVLAADAAGNPVSGAAVTLALTTGTGTLSGPATQLTDGTGTATFGGLSVDRAGAGKQLTATSSSASPVTSNAFTVTAGTPTAISFTQQPGNAASGAAITPPVVVHVTDTVGNAVPGVSVALTKKSGPGTLSGTLNQTTDASGNATFGNLSANLVGTYIVTATSGSLTADSSAFAITAGMLASLSFTQQPASGAAFASGAAIAPAYKVLAADAAGNPVSGAAVTLALTTGTGTLSGAATQVTDGTGTATLGGLSVDRAGAGKRLTATSGSAPSALSNTFTVTAGTPTAISFTQQPRNALPNAAISPSVKVQLLDAASNPVPGVPVTLLLSGGSGTLTVTQPQTTDATGIASFADASVNAAGTYQLTASGAGLTAASSIFTITTGTAASLIFTAQPTTTTAGASIAPPVVVHVADAANNAVPGIAVSLSKTSGPSLGTVSGTLTQATDASGNATFGNLSANLAGTYQLTATSGSLTSPPSSPFTITAGAAANIAFTVQPSGTASGLAIAPPVVVKVTDTFGNVVEGVGVSLVLAPGSTGTLSGTSPKITDAGGNATFNDLQINLAGVKQLTATSGSLIVNSTTFTVTAGTPTALSFTQQPTNTASGAAITPPVVLHLQDAAGNPVVGSTVVLTKKSGPGTLSGTLAQTTDASGNATFSTLSANLVGSYQLTATDAADALTVDSSAFTITTGAAAGIAFTQQPTSTASGAAITPPVVVHLQDAAGNPLLGVPVTLTLSGGPGALSGTITQATDPFGNATFPDLTVDRVGTTYTLTAAAAGLTIASDKFAVTPAAAAAITFTTQPSNSVAGKIIAPPVVVIVTDPAGNPVPLTGVSLTLSTGSSPGGTTIQVSDARGRATFSDLSITQIGTYQIVATSGSLTPITSNAFTITAGAASTLTFTKQPTDTISGANISPAVVATLTDAKGNPVVGATVALTKKSGPGTLSGTLNQTTDASGNATFGNLSANLVGTYIVTATSGSLTVDSSTFTLAAGAATTISFTTPPTSTTAGAPIAPPVAVQLLDAGGNPVAGAAIALALSGGAGTLGGTPTQISDANGNATFSGLSVNKVGSTYVLRATSGNATPVTSSTFAITPGPGLLSFTVQPSSTASDAPIAPPVVVQFLDGTGNPIVGASVSLALPIGSAAILSGTSTQTTDANGNATFSSLTVNAVGIYTLTATSGGLSSPLSSPFSITAGPATQISFTQQPVTGARFGFGASLTPPSITLQVLDAANNPVVGIPVLLSLAVGAGPLNGPATQLTDATGTATFSGLSISSPGSAQLKAVSGSLSVLGNVFMIGNPTATISGLSTNVGLVHAGDPPFILTIAGGGFAPGAVVTFNGLPSNAPTSPQITNVTVNSAGTQVTASIAASLVTTAGSYNVTVTNPGTADSTIKPFLVLPLGPTADASGTTPHPADSNLNTQYFDSGLQMISVPFDYTKDTTGKSLGVNDVLRVFNLTDPSLATPSLPDLSDTETLGTLAVWNPSAAAYALTSPGSTAGLADQLVLGRGYWGHLRYQPVIPGIETGLKTRGLEAKDITNALNTQRQFSITLKPGWNMIGDPFTGSVNLRDLQVQDGNGNAFSLVDANTQALVSNTLYRYSLANGGMGYVALSPTKSDILAPYVGYWVLAYQPCTLLVPSP